MTRGRGSVGVISGGVAGAQLMMQTDQQARRRQGKGAVLISITEPPLQFGSTRGTSSRVRMRRLVLTAGHVSVIVSSFTGSLHYCPERDGVLLTRIQCLHVQSRSS